MNRRKLITLLCLAIASLSFSAISTSDDTLVLRGKAAQVSIALGGGGITEFRFSDESTNPLNWEISQELEPKQAEKPYLRGHFLCLDRWGAPSDAEKENGMPFHGEAPRVVWQVLKPPQRAAGKVVSEMGCVLPLAGMSVKRHIELDEAAAFFIVTEEVSNANKLGRIYNMVQHPSIAPPFLDEATLVDANARHGFVQEGPLPESHESAAVWPVVKIDERDSDLRQFKNAAEDATGHDVSSFVFDESDQYGWVTACNPRLGLLLGYVWRTADYPWLNIWRYIFKGRVTARGLEFGTTGYHQPFPELVKTGKILGTPLYEYIDAGETTRKSYAAFLIKIPRDFEGVARLSYADGKITLLERRSDSPRTLKLEVGKLFQECE